jgi:hypothetical protein
LLTGKPKLFLLDEVLNLPNLNEHSGRKVARYHSVIEGEAVLAWESQFRYRFEIRTRKATAKKKVSIALWSPCIERRAAEEYGSGGLGRTAMGVPKPYRAKM